VRIVGAVSAGGSDRHHRALVGNRLQEVWARPVVIEKQAWAPAAHRLRHWVARFPIRRVTPSSIVGRRPGHQTSSVYPSLSYDPFGDFCRR